jgi:hypothetical protein
MKTTECFLPYGQDRLTAKIGQQVITRMYRGDQCRTVALIQSRKPKPASMTEVLTIGSHVDC